MSNIGNICSCHIFIIEKRKSLHEAAVLMKKHSIKKLLIVEENDHDYFPIGFLTSYDIVINVIVHERNAKKTKIEEIMQTGNLLCANENEKIEEVLKIMADNRIEQMPVMDQDNKLIGMANADNIVLFLERKINSIPLKHLFCRKDHMEFNCLNLVSKIIAAQIPEHFNYEC